VRPLPGVLATVIGCHRAIQPQGVPCRTCGPASAPLCPAVPASAGIWNCLWRWGEQTQNTTSRLSGRGGLPDLYATCLCGIMVEN